MKTYLSVAIGQLIREKRKEAGLSLKELAKYLDVAQSHMSNFECGNVLCNITTIYKIAKFLKVSPKDLIPDKIIVKLQRQNEKNTSIFTQKLQ